MTTESMQSAGVRRIPRGIMVECPAKASAARWTGSPLGDNKAPVMAYVGDTAVLRTEITMHLSKV